MKEAALKNNIKHLNVHSTAVAFPFIHFPALPLIRACPCMESANPRIESVVITESVLTFLPATEEMAPLLLFLALKLPEQTHPLIVSKQGQKSSI